MPRARKDDSPDVRLSKAMSYVLRHGAEKEKIKVQQDGYVDVEEILKSNRFKSAGYTLEDIQRVVANNNKDRFSLKQSADDNKWYVRANQGHSFAVEIEMKKLARVEDFPPNVIHGTNRKAWESIKTQGLSRMNRLHIHMARGKPGEDGVISGMRQNATVLIHIDVAKALDAGLEFFESANGVILTSGDKDGMIKPELFLKVETANGESLEKKN